MPLPKHTVQPVKLSQVVVPNGVDNELEFVVNSTVCNVMRQIASISRLANNMFEELTTDLSQLVERTVRLQNRLSKLHEDMQVARNGDEDLTAAVQEVELPMFTSKKPTDSQVLNRNTIPPSMRSHYDQAEPAPALQQMDALRDDKKVSMKLYSDPSFFFDLWSQEMLQDHKHKRAAKKKRPKVKGKSAPAKSASNQAVQKPQLIIQQPGVGGHNPPTAMFERNGPINTNLHLDKDTSTVHGKPIQSQFPNSANFGSAALPPPPPPPVVLHPLTQVDSVKDVQHIADQRNNFQSSKPVFDGNNQFSANNHMNGNHDPSSAHQMTLPEPPKLPVQMPMHVVPPPLPPPAFMNDFELKAAGVNKSSLQNDDACSRDLRTQNGNSELSASIHTQVNNVNHFQCATAESMESSMVLNDLPPPPAPIFIEKSLMESCSRTEEFSESEKSAQKAVSALSPPPPPPAAPYLASSPQTSLPGSPMQPPPPPPPLPPSLVTTQKTGHETSKDQTSLPNKDSASRCIVPQCPPQDLLSAIRAGLKLRKVGERNLPDPSKFSRANSLSVLGNTPKDVQAVEYLYCRQYG
ncbi:unnamed protein product [Heterobilharzia americana]|nr:unnamed protein product [Heterobilharzia americana]CAH8641670.1 unnamed protein product [Heterobilharzia americana]